MRVLWLIRENLTDHPGGDTTQIHQTAEALRARGVHVDLCSESHPTMAGYDVVHLWHLDRLWENEAYCRQLRTQGRPAVLSTIYWPADEFDRHGRVGWQGWLARRLGSSIYQNLRLTQRWALHLAHKPSLSGFRAPFWRFRRAIRFVLESVSVLLPNSRAEQQQIEQHFGIRRPAVIVPNAADTKLFSPAEKNLDRPRNGVLCVGRLEPRKNQLALIKALRETEIPLTLVGQAGRYSGAYHRRCQQAAGANVEIVDQQPPEVLRRLYRQAQVHACVSWYETPGLVSLEASLCGCAIVVTPGGCTREYFGENAYYCQPDNPGSIRLAVETALEHGPGLQLTQRVAREFTWAATAEKTLEGYRLARQIRR